MFWLAHFGVAGLLRISFFGPTLYRAVGLQSMVSRSCTYCLFCLGVAFCLWGFKGARRADLYKGP